MGGETKPRHRYLELLALPHAKRLALASALHRCASFALSFCLMVVLTQRRGSIAEAGLASGLFLLASAVGEPTQGRICDRYGARRPLVVITAAFVVCFVGLVAVIVTNAPLWLLYPASLACGAAMPFVRGPSRTLWWRIATTDADRITASAFEGTVGPLSYASGYLIFALSSLVVGSLGALIIAGLLLVAGAAGIGSLVEPGAPAGAAKRNFLATLRNKPLLAVLFINFVCFWTYGLLQVALIARTSGGTASLLLSLVLFSTAAYGLAWGARHRKQAPEREQVSAVASFLAAALALTLAALSPLWLLIPFLVVHGATRSPLLTYTYHLSAAYAPAEQRTEAVAWNGAVIWAGTAVGKTIGGAVAGSFGTGAVLISGLPLVGLTLLCALWLHWHRRGERQRGLVEFDASA